ncbi:hypothetical protein EJ05DRAFT_498701 [Pseudovirgaria hyperparasitica]|uniref:Cyclase n=1 Tax=Pseudovirgaria hyperparasitica TaxID=470096 RepID=A0A6A6WC01_9PEZI|nr:uncharacterized protein EJ05DRAFT_498701 [Pseudovirgaria hyperparasitica]KAF2759490.1 hypothetical protein EJ05DRAFT_498701 [Pseudovirgaria hyperparasitica]
MAQKDPYDLKFDELPNPMRVWKGPPGSHEEALGKVSILTPDVVAKAASQEIRTGRRVTVNWSLEQLEYAPFGRIPVKHSIIPILDGDAFDDIYTFNPQQSSQWDGLRHFSQPKFVEDGQRSVERVFYGGTTKTQIYNRTNSRLGIQAWASEGIAGRGVLIDYAWWAEKQGIEYSTFSQHHVKLSDITQIAKECDIIFQRGDILIVRIGMTKEWNSWSDQAKQEYASQSNPLHAGVENSMDVLRWIWDTGFSAVAGDAISWEVRIPIPVDRRSFQSDVPQVFPSINPPLFLHEYLLAGWGMPIGEMFDLEALSQTCQELDRWTFFVTSAPLNMPGGVSSPPNALMIF